MDPHPSPLPEPRQILKLARTDKRAAAAQVGALSLDGQVALVCSTPVELRAAVLALTPVPEEVIPLLPEAELCFTAKAIGLWDASWLFEHATESQLVASFDLDGWEGLQPDRASLRNWLAAIAEAGDETLLRTARAIDPELLVLMIRDRVEVMLDPRDDDWQAPPGAHTIDGMFYVLPRQANDDIPDLLALLRAIFGSDYWLYFRMLQGAIWELDSDLEEWALRWRTGRLQDLGFPAWDEAMRIYGYIRPADRAAIPQAVDALDVVAWGMPVYMPELPIRAGRDHSIFRAAAELDDDERQRFLYAFIAIANKVAIADRMPLGDADTLPKAIETAASVTSVGLNFLAEKNGLPLSDTLRRVSLERMFRVGASLDGRKPPPIPTFEKADDASDAD